MEFVPQNDGVEILGIEALSREAHDQSSIIQVGNSVLRNVRRISALGLATATFFNFGPSALQTAGAAEHSDNGQPDIYQTDSQLKPEAQTSSTHTLQGQDANLKCTPITTSPGGYDIGRACQNDTLYKRGESNPSGFSYGMLVVDGIYKCGWVQDGILKTVPGENLSITDSCKQAYRQLTFNPRSIFSVLNCAPGACTDGSSPDPITPECDHRIMANFATKNKTIFNLRPNKYNSGFSDVVAVQYQPVHFRATTKDASVLGKAIVVRNNSSWGFMRANCAPPKFDSLSPVSSSTS